MHGGERSIRGVLNSYARATGQFINPDKCSILFGEHCRSSDREEVVQVLQAQNVQFEEKYLGLPTPQGRMSKGWFQNLQERLTNNLVLWGDSQLAQSGREVLIKSVGQALPTYLMSVFRLPAATCDDITSMLRNYWWGAAKGRRKTNWRAWKDLIQPKSHGGMGFKDMRIFNQALLARQAWRILTVPDSLCARVLKARYFPNGDMLDTVFSGSASVTWQAIVHGLELLKKGIIWRVGNGASIRIWRDK